MVSQQILSIGSRTVYRVSRGPILERLFTVEEQELNASSDLEIKEIIDNKESIIFYKLEN